MMQGVGNLNLLSRQSPKRHARTLATAHGLRCSFRDCANDHGYARDLAERALAHTVANKVEAAYHRTDLLEQSWPLMEAWGAARLKAVTPAPNSRRQLVQ